MGRHGALGLGKTLYVHQLQIAGCALSILHGAIKSQHCFSTPGRVDSSHSLYSVDPVTL
jgi:hypothetical protein